MHGGDSAGTGTSHAIHLTTAQKRTNNSFVDAFGNCFLASLEKWALLCEHQHLALLYETVQENCKYCSRDLGKSRNQLLGSSNSSRTIFGIARNLLEQ